MTSRGSAGRVLIGITPAANGARKARGSAMVIVGFGNAGVKGVTRGQSTCCSGSSGARKSSNK
eukprot:12890530-Prorocentrum_lima.AAC.1